MSEIARPLLITTVHGTWARGLRPKPQRDNRRWFGKESLFLDRIIRELGDTPHKITPLLWSGANSIRKRDETAHVLAEHLSAEHAEHPQATQLVIAHSHGGNIALRALYLLRKRDATRTCGAEMPPPLVVTLATPFIEVQHTNLGNRSRTIRLGVLYAMAYLILTVLLSIWGVHQLNEFIVLGVMNIVLVRGGLPPLDESGTAIIIAALLALPFALSVFLWWQHGRAPARQRHIGNLSDATRFGEVVPAQAQRLLIIRAIDDEASLTMALGTIIGYATTAIIVAICAVVTLVFQFPPLFFKIPNKAALITYLGWKGIALIANSVAALMLSLFGIFMISRAVHGRELSWSPMECQISTHSTPDAIGLSKIVTLVRRTYVGSLRHGIYEHEDCVDRIADWVRSQFRGAQPNSHVVVEDTSAERNLTPMETSVASAH
jgi:hypothetical protein